MVQNAMTIGPEPKPIQMGGKIHLLCMSKCDIGGYKLHACTYGGASDESLCMKRNDTVTWILSSVHHGERTLCDDGFCVHGGYYWPDWLREVGD